MTCTDDDYCTKYNKALYSALEIKDADKPTDEKSPSYSGMYCDKTEGVCKFWAGYVASLDEDSYKTNKFIRPFCHRFRGTSNTRYLC